MGEFQMPSLGADMEAGTLVEWLKRPGDHVVRGDIIAVVDTQKGAIEIEIFEAGVINRILVDVGQKVPVGTVLAIIDGEAAASPPVPLAGAHGRPPSTPPPIVRRTMPGAPEGASRRRITPAARQAARTLNVALETVTGTGPGGAVTLDDVEKASTRSAAAAASGPDRAGAMRAAIAAAMARSKREIPHFYLSTTIDMTRALSWLAVENERRPVTERLLPIALLLRAVARALVEVPGLNGFWIDGAFRPGPGIHIGCAVSLRGGGLVAPALHDADRKDLQTLMKDLRDLVGRARSGSLRSSEMSDPTITVTNLGDMGVESALAIIYPPQVALVAFGKIADRPWVVGGKVEPRPLLIGSLSADHRAVDGHRGGLFLAAVDRLLQSPETL
jgi:pyruvate dehydrogenase E2 component (dihydrolipoamide acetyltransferase)